MDRNSDWDADSQAGAESFEQGDEAMDEELRLNPGFLEAVEDDPSLDPTMEIDQLELEEAGLKLDDPADLE